MKTYSVTEIAEKIGLPGEDLRVVGDRIRNWTREGLLKPVGEKNPGTGRSRQYPETALLDALLLTALTESVGLQVVKVHGFAEIFDHARQYLKSQSKSSTLLVIARDARSGSYVSVQRPDTLGKFIANSAVDAHIVINLAQLRERLYGNRP
ncbi:MerR family transcriptional regulator [Bradyrhizobium sp. GCM10027634]|uniref:MerR family transcriptional regulator n=1 Tax=unclassified Bradyrhizobium TaxID=2631580 RepID=UPI00263BCE39|nr:MerR family transcriptional regulator [Bradyrhizobium sp. WYCCWR 12677]MDN5003989.1 MerR family transcriptional regulator [Bradyrhizobium sp. WYCCWR 12677]